MTTLLRPLLGALAILAPLLSAAPAVAGGNAAATIDNVRLGVLDLTPDDGVAPGFDIVEIAPSLYASLYGVTGEYFLSGYPRPGMPGTVDLEHGNAGAVAHTTGLLGDVTAHATGDTALGEYGYLSASSNQALHLMLRPHTVLTISGHLTTRANRTGGDRADYDVGGMAYVGIVDGNGYTFTSFSRQSYSYGLEPDWLALDEDFTLAFANGGAVDAPVSVYLQALANAARYAAPVPEPRMGSMLGAGMLMLGLAGLRRRRGARPGRAR